MGDNWECTACEYGPCWSESEERPKDEMCRYFGQFYRKQRWRMTASFLIRAVMNPESLRRPEDLVLKFEKNPQPTQQEE